MRKSGLIDNGSLITDNVSLRRFNTFGIEANARHFAEITRLEDLRALLTSPVYGPMDKLVLGGGSNLLFTRDFDGLVLKINLPGIQTVREDDAHAWVRAGAGVNWHDLVVHCLDHDYAGIENLSLIWGTVGAAPMQNIGAYGVEIKDVFEELEAVRISDGSLRPFGHADCRFGYRESVFKHDLKGQYIITSVTLRLDKQPVFHTSYGAIADTLREMGANLSIRAISEAVCRIRTSKLPDPHQIGNAGSFFKNPEMDEAAFDRLRSQHPTVPHYPAPAGQVKVPAGWLIEQCGWKGKRVGNAGVHAQQALVLVNYGEATGAEIQRLSERVQASVAGKFGIALQAEVNVV
ncbi:MAG: UDP-N-acetylmuramate dehydrogenase [Ferruginibacter sp.]|nr:UDP-N-acetylmuramate dehydrogenase [Cytophagales bacterium]